MTKIFSNVQNCPRIGMAPKFFGYLHAENVTQNKCVQKRKTSNSAVREPILAPNFLASDGSNDALRSSQNLSGAELWTKTCRKNETLKAASGALFTHFYAIKIQKYFAWWVFGPIPTSGASFTGIGLGDRTRPYTKVLHFLTFCLLRLSFEDIL